MENLVNYFDKAENSQIIAESGKTFFSLPISQLVTENDYKIAFATFKSATEKSEYKIAKIVERIYTEKINGERPFDEYIEKVFGVKKSQAYNYIKACKLIDKDGNFSLLVGEKVALDYSITALVKLIESGKTFEQLKEMHDKAEISPEMSIVKLVAKFRGKKDDITADSVITAESIPESEKTESGKAEKTESGKAEKTEKQPLTITAIFNDLLKTLNENGYTFLDLVGYYDSINK